LKKHLFNISVNLKMERIFILVEHFAGKIRAVSYELVGVANLLSSFQPAEIKAILLGENIENLAKEFSEKSDLETFAISVPGLETYNAGVYKEALLNLFKEFPFSFCLSSHSTQGLDFVPALAVKQGAGCITAVELIEEKDNDLIYKRSISGGKLITSLKNKAPSLFLTIQPGSFKSIENGTTFTAKVIQRVYSSTSSTVRNITTKSLNVDSSRLSEAKVIISVGRGIGDEEHLELIDQLAALFPKSAIAGSRPLCDLGWLEYKQQVGVTGATVSPDLYLACGISGTSQHVIGMKGSGLIVSINLDPNAAINNVSDICVVEDLKTFIPVLLEEHHKRRLL